MARPTGDLDLCDSGTIIREEHGYEWPILSLKAQRRSELDRQNDYEELTDNRRKEKIESSRGQITMVRGLISVESLHSYLVRCLMDAMVLDHFSAKLAERLSVMERDPFSAESTKSSLVNRILVTNWMSGSIMDTKKKKTKNERCRQLTVRTSDYLLVKEKCRDDHNKDECGQCRIDRTRSTGNTLAAEENEPVNDFSSENHSIFDFILQFDNVFDCNNDRGTDPNRHVVITSRNGFVREQARPCIHRSFAVYVQSSCSQTSVYSHRNGKQHTSKDIGSFNIWDRSPCQQEKPPIARCDTFPSRGFLNEAVYIPLLFTFSLLNRGRGSTNWSVSMGLVMTLMLFCGSAAGKPVLLKTEEDLASKAINIYLMCHIGSGCDYYLSISIGFKEAVMVERYSSREVDELFEWTSGMSIEREWTQLTDNDGTRCGEYNMKVNRTEEPSLVLLTILYLNEELKFGIECDFEVAQNHTMETMKALKHWPCYLCGDRTLLEDNPERQHWRTKYKTEWGMTEFYKTRDPNKRYVLCCVKNGHHKENTNLRLFINRKTEDRNYHGIILLFTSYLVFLVLIFGVSLIEQDRATNTEVGVYLETVCLKLRQEAVCLQLKEDFDARKIDQNGSMKMNENEKIFFDDNKRDTICCLGYDRFYPLILTHKVKVSMFENNSMFDQFNGLNVLKTNKSIMAKSDKGVPSSLGVSYPLGCSYGVLRRRHRTKYFMKAELLEDDNKTNDKQGACEKSHFVMKLVDISRNIPNSRKCQQTLLKVFHNDFYMRQEIMKCMRMHPESRSFELLKLLVLQLSHKDMVVEKRNLRTNINQMHIDSILNAMSAGFQKHGAFHGHSQRKPLISTYCPIYKKDDCIKPLEQRILKQDEFENDVETGKEGFEDIWSFQVTIEMIKKETDNALNIPPPFDDYESVVNHDVRNLIKRISNDNMKQNTNYSTESVQHEIPKLNEKCSIDRVQNDSPQHIGFISRKEGGSIKNIERRFLKQDDIEIKGEVCSEYFKKLHVFEKYENNLDYVENRLPPSYCFESVATTELSNLSERDRNETLKQNETTSTESVQNETPKRNDCYTRFVTLREDDFKPPIPCTDQNLNTPEPDVEIEKGYDWDQCKLPVACTEPHLSISVDNVHEEEKQQHTILLKTSKKTTKNGPSPPRRDEDVIDTIRELTRLQSLPVPSLEQRDLIVANVTFTTLDTVFSQLGQNITLGPEITMKFELLRLCTLRNYPKENKPYLVRFAAAGFYYAAEGDEVVCYCCAVRRNNWTADEDPETVHRRLTPRCSFFLRNEQVNFPVPRIGSDLSAKFAFLEEFIAPIIEGSDFVRSTDGVSHSRTNENGSTSSPARARAQSLGISTASAKHPHYAVKAVRLNSFQGWPTSSNQDPTILAEAGFYFAGIGDCVRCFFCGIGLRHWTEEDDPNIEHARWSEHCQYLRQFKGEEFVNLVQMALRFTQDVCLILPRDISLERLLKTFPTICHMAGLDKDHPSEPGSQPNEEVTRILRTDAAQSVVEMGYDARIIKQAIDALLRENGRSGMTAERIMEKVLALEETEGKAQKCGMQNGDESNSNKLKSPNRSAPVSNTSESRVRETLQGASQRATGLRGGEEAGSNQKAGNGQNPRQIRAENEKLKEQTMCKICLDKNVCVVFLPCGHLVTCAECAPALRKCPICRSIIKGTVKTYMS